MKTLLYTAFGALALYTVFKPRTTAQLPPVAPNTPVPIDEITYSDGTGLTYQGGEPVSLGPVNHGSSAPTQTSINVNPIVA